MYSVRQLQGDAKYCCKINRLQIEVAGKKVLPWHASCSTIGLEERPGSSAEN